MIDPGSATAPSSPFEQHRDFLQALAYRLLGAVSDAEDIVQETYLRWAQADRAAITEPRAYLARITTRLCLDHIKSARVRRETYVGQWLPEPLVQAAGFTEKPADDLAQDISYALMLALERLSPLERAAFLLHDVFGLPFEEIAATLDRTAATCRQLAIRARGNVRSARPRFAVPAAEGERLTAQFMRATQTGDIASFTQLLAEDAVLHSDGGGRVRAALRPITGRDRITRFFVGILAKNGPAARSEVTTINGQPGFIKSDGTSFIGVFTLEFSAGKISAIYLMRNPDKLRHLALPPARGSAPA